MNRQDLVAIDRDARHRIGDRPFRNAFDGGGPGNRGRHAVTVVFANENHRQFPNGGHVQRFVKGAFVVGTVTEKAFTEAGEKKSCSFERIYFSRGNDSEIYKQRKRLGEQLVEQVIEGIENDFEHTVLSFIPNTAETAYFGQKDAHGCLVSQWVAQWVAMIIDILFIDNV